MGYIMKDFADVIFLSVIWLIRGRVYILLPNRKERLVTVSPLVFVEMMNVSLVLPLAKFCENTFTKHAFYYRERTLLSCIEALNYG
jgi:hypothetical protein